MQAIPNYFKTNVVDFSVMSSDDFQRFLYQALEANFVLIPIPLMDNAHVEKLIFAFHPMRIQAFINANSPDNIKMKVRQEFSVEGTRSKIVYNKTNQGLLNRHEPIGHFQTEIHITKSELTQYVYIVMPPEQHNHYRYYLDFNLRNMDFNQSNEHTILTPNTDYPAEIKFPYEHIDSFKVDTVKNDCPLLNPNIINLPVTKIYTYNNKLFSHYQSYNEEVQAREHSESQVDLFRNIALRESSYIHPVAFDLVPPTHQLTVPLISKFYTATTQYKEINRNNVPMNYGEIIQSNTPPIQIYNSFYLVDKSSTAYSNHKEGLCAKGIYEHGFLLYNIFRYFIYMTDNTQAFSETRTVFESPKEFTVYDIQNNAFDEAIRQGTLLEKFKTTRRQKFKSSFYHAAYREYALDKYVIVRKDNSTKEGLNEILGFIDVPRSTFSTLFFHNTARGNGFLSNFTDSFHPTISTNKVFERKTPKHLCTIKMLENRNNYDIFYSTIANIVAQRDSLPAIRESTPSDIDRYIKEGTLTGQRNNLPQYSRYNIRQRLFLNDKLLSIKEFIIQNPTRFNRYEQIISISNMDRGYIEGIFNRLTESQNQTSDTPAQPQDTTPSQPEKQELYQQLGESYAKNSKKSHTLTENFFRYPAGTKFSSQELLKVFYKFNSHPDHYVGSSPQKEKAFNYYVKNLIDNN